MAKFASKKLNYSQKSSSSSAGKEDSSKSSSVSSKMSSFKSSSVSKSGSPTSISSNELMADVFLMEDDGTLINSDNRINDKNITEKFYLLHPEKTYYDFLSIFISFKPSLSQLPFHGNVKNNVKGVGGPQITSSYLGDSNKLLGTNFLGWNFTSPYIKTETDVKTNLWVLFHETAHQWLLYIGVEENFSDGLHYTIWTDTGFMRDNQQWNDVMGGSSWKDNGDGTMSKNRLDKQGFSKLSLYLMGLIPQSEVPDLRIVVPENPQDQASLNVQGKFKTISINDIISKYGMRVPSYQTSQKDFKMAYILLSKKSEPPTKDQIDAINYVAKNFPVEWSFVTYGKSTINSTTR